MNCKNCGFDLVAGQDICPRCGVSQSAQDEMVQGVSMELPTAESPKAEAQPKEEKQEKVKETAKKATEKVKETAQKAKEASKAAAESISESAQEAVQGAKKGGSKTWLYVVIGVVGAAVLIFVGLMVIKFEPKSSSDETFVMMAATEDDIYMVEGGTLTAITETNEDLSPQSIIMAADSSSFYVIMDAEYDEDADRYVGDLVYLKANGKQTDIDSDVCVYTLDIVGGVLWYERADKEDVIVCSYDGKNVNEVIEEDGLYDWYGTDDANKAFYTLMDDKDYTTEVFVTEKGDSTSLMEEAEIVALSSDYKKALIISYDDDTSILNIYDGKEDFEVMEDVQDVAIDLDTFDMIVVADIDDMNLYYIPYGKEEVEIDDEVQQIFPINYEEYLSSGVVAMDGIGSYIYYAKDDDMYKADIKGKNSERILKNYEELEAIDFDLDAKVLIYVDDDEVVKFSFDTLKEESVELPDANDLSSYEVVLAGDWYVYFTEDYEAINAYDGSKKDPIELTDDGEDISDFEAFMDKYVLWLTYDDELVICAMQEGSGEEIGDEIYDYWTTEDGSIYYLSEYEDGEADLYFISKVGKDAEKIEKGIVDTFNLYYE